MRPPWYFQGMYLQRCSKEKPLILYPFGKVNHRIMEYTFAFYFLVKHSFFVLFYYRSNVLVPANSYIVLTMNQAQL